MTTQEPSVITRLRTRTATGPVVPTVAQLRRLRDELRLADTTLDRASRMVGLTPDQVLQTVTEVGKWLLQSNKLELPTLITAEEYRVKAAELGRKSSRYRDHAAGQLSMFNMPSRPAPKRRKAQLEYVAPAPGGFLDAGALTLRKPLAALLAHDISDDQIDRWVARTFTASLPMLTFPVVAAVWRMATLDMLDRLDQVSPSPSFAKVAVEAWELLEYARYDAIVAVATLTGSMLEAADAPLPDGKRIKLASDAAALAERTSWVCEQDMLRLARAARALETEPRLQSTFVGELKNLRQRSRTHPGVYRIEGIGQIREGQMIRIVQLAGLPTEAPDPKGAADIRRRIRKLDLGRDADQLVPNAVVASQAGRLDEYLGILEARASGDVTWLEQMLALASERRDVQHPS